MTATQSHAELIRDTLEAVADKSFQENRWGERHYQAWHAPRHKERGVVDLLKAAANYADLHRHNHGSRIGEDYVLGPPWAQILVSVRALLNGECGRLDCGTLDSLILSMLTLEGFDEDGEHAK